MIVTSMGRTDKGIIIFGMIDTAGNEDTIYITEHRLLKALTMVSGGEGSVVVQASKLKPQPPTTIPVRTVDSM